VRASSAEIPDLEAVDEPLPYEELRRLTADLPQKERAAVFLRYGYDLSYEDIGAALGSSTEAARQAASSGVRRLRRKELS
jgi:DNA-directed RNA polymerase specialized sigma24 family protein